MAVCCVCGADDSERDTWRFCSERRQFVCKQCEEVCEHYSKAMLPNGVHCKLKYFPISMYLVSQEVISANRNKYDMLDNLALVTSIDEMRKRYVRCEDKELRRSYQIRLAAAQTVLEERQEKSSALYFFSSPRRI